MSICEMSKKSLLNCEVDCSIVGIDGHQENGPGDNIYQLDLMKDGKYYTTPLEEVMDDDDKMITATSNDNFNHQDDRLANVADQKMIEEDKSVKTWSKSKGDSGSASGGEHDACNQDDTTDVLGKKRKTRRGKPKRRKLKPYTKQNSLFLPRQLSRKNSNKQIKTLPPQPPAPYNTNEFLIEDHNDLPELDQKLSVGTITTNASDIHVLFQKPNPPPRTRDSSFSIDSDSEYFYSSPEDEEEFLEKEFSSAYADLHAERLSSLSKTELIQEYVQLESKIELITKGTKNIDTKLSTTNFDDIVKKLKYYQQKVDDLSKQNDQLKRDNEALRRKRNDSVSSVDSESDSDSSSSNSNSSGTSISGNIDDCNGRISVDSDSMSSKEESPGKKNIEMELTNGHSKNHASQRVADVPT